MDTEEIKLLTDRLIPQPKEISFSDGPLYLIRSGCRVKLLTPSPADEAGKTAAALFQANWEQVPEIAVVPDPEAAEMPADAYGIDVSETELSIRFKGNTGLLNAMKTLRQLAAAVRGTERTAGYYLHLCAIQDGPALGFRGIHLCIFPETPLWDIEKQIRLAAYHKFNYAVIETWGVFPFETHPEFCWPDCRIDKAELKRLIRLGREIGITLIPALNILGHAPWSRGITGKHAVLDFNPSLQPLFEPEGWSWCISNPNTRRILTDLTMELYEFYDRPPFFHIGCDEADPVGTCPECRKYELKDLIRDHILYFHDLFQKQDCRVIIWHDMLLEQGDPRWEGYIINGYPEQHLSELYKELPRDIVIADWQYNRNVNPGEPEPEWPTARFFNQEKFSVLVCPWNNKSGIASLGRLAAKEKMLGLLETTWHMAHNQEYMNIFVTAACAAWNPDAEIRQTFRRRMALANHVRQIGWDMKVRQYERTGFSQHQVDPGHHPHPVF